jgi:hypothetical protein
MQRMEERMQTMHKEMQQIREAKDPQERQRLIEQHRNTMREQMQDMHRGHMMMGMMDDDMDCMGGMGGKHDMR